MFESAELGHSVDEATWSREVPPLREALLDAQYELLEKKRFPVVVLINGVDGAGKGETVNLLHEWMDPRHIESVAFDEPNDEERMRPPMWRYWRELPPKGKLGIFFGSWYTEPIVGRVEGHTKKLALESALERIRGFERMLTDEGVLLLKFWFHLSKKAQKERLEALEANPRTRWRVTKDDWRRYREYDAFRDVSATVLRETSTGHAPWTIVEGVDERYRGLTVGKAVLDGLTRRLVEKPRPAEDSPEEPKRPVVAKKTILGAVDLTKTASKKKYAKELEDKQRALSMLSRHPRFADRACVLVYEGVDAAGKGGNIRRVTGALDARRYRVVPIAAPTEEERAQPYLWRFWRHLPKKGRFAIFDRSWYGRVLVERVERFAPEGVWKRAYAEINDFEEQLVDSGIVLVKLWIHIDKKEQKKRFEERQKTGYKRFKITGDDWRNRAKWTAYEEAACDMFERTSTDIAPWKLVAGTDKHHARLEALGTIVSTLEAAL